MSALISVIIPVFNERDAILRSVTSASNDENVEIIICDGGSVDGTLEILTLHFQNQVCIHKCSRGRSKCMNYGSSVSSGDILLFLHADTILPTNYGSAVRNAIAGTFIYIKIPD